MISASGKVNYRVPFAESDDERFGVVTTTSAIATGSDVVLIGYFHPNISRSLTRRG